ncbi:hypothetical protein I3760_Q005000 [Carya illinoinensis]|nr:hypothetical protein I3760_Q005000 [Carya illinoinensis]
MKLLKVGNMVREREGKEKKLSTTYSLGRDKAGSLSKSLLPIYRSENKELLFSRCNEREHDNILDTQ